MNTFYRIFAAILISALFGSEAFALQTQPDSLNKDEKPLTFQKPEPFRFDPFGKDLSDTTSMGFQFSFVPYVGTNGMYSGNIVNDYSFNLLGGYSAGTRKLEMAGLFNINRSDMTGVQLAGLFNQVGGKVDGVQLAGLFNSNLDSVKNSVQLAGLMNFTTGPVDGVQIAGVANFSPKKVEGVQVAGVMNFTADDLEGSQVAGVLNFAARDVKGSQVGLVNFGNKVDGFQLGLINYSDSISGVPVGFLTFVRSGYHTLELSVNEVLPLNLAFRTGKREFYNIFFAGIRPEWDDQVVWSFGYGLGTSPRLGKKTFLNIEVSSEQLSQGGVHALNLINRGYIGAEFQATKNFALFAGPTVNFRVYDSSYAFHPELFTYTNTTIHNDVYHPEDLGSQFWWGFKAGFRFL
ncbi:LA_2272 family surface repeat-containing protein [Algoriphagus sp. A40]|uniref:LA_2272 family surface repeat-containing protein n=1 Tax=Algoriphagus sp. A40 TaxID=1945863 RepID=UPI0009848E38|nr:hypothetical protein [Algoriphagus sp. A40]OOG72982.1 hypothetical protein B0E43_13710 [Algoriphagus sp. A40]